MDHKHDLICDRCGGMMEFSVDRKEMHCPYCDNIVLLPDKDQEEKVAYAKRKAELDAQHEQYEKSQRVERRRLNISKLIALLVVASIVLTPFIIALFSLVFRPVINPYDYIDVSFEGIDGNGQAVVELIKTDNKVKNIDDLHLTVSQTYYLSENDVITISTNPVKSTCWHTESSRKYVVKGLELFLNDLNSINSSAEKLIHQKSEQLIGMAIDDKPQITNLKHEKFYLLSDGEKENLMYDVYSATWELVEGNDKTIYLVAYYENIIVHDDTFSYDNCMYTGDILSEGSFHNGVVTAFESFGDIELDLNTNRAPDMVLTEK